MKYICEGQALVLPCSVLSTVYYQLISLLNLQLLLMIIIDDESINEMKFEHMDVSVESEIIQNENLMVLYVIIITSKTREEHLALVHVTPPIRRPSASAVVCPVCPVCTVCPVCPADRLYYTVSLTRIT